MHPAIWFDEWACFLQNLSQTGVMSRPPSDTDRRPCFALRRRALLLGGAALGGVAITGAPRATSASLREEDVRALNLLLLVEQTQVAFYTEAVRVGALKGEVLQYARQVASQEEEHLAVLKRLLGGQARGKPDFDFGDRTRQPDAFAAAAADVEDLAVGAYNGQGGNVSRDVLAGAATIVSVEARHAAWIRSIVGQLPASDATDPALSNDEVLEGLSRLGVRR
jgi:rubrerythrin